MTGQVFRLVPAARLAPTMLRLATGGRRVVAIANARPGTLCGLVIRGPADAQRAVRAALAGADLVLSGVAGPLLDDLLDELGRIGEVREGEAHESD